MVQGGLRLKTQMEVTAVEIKMVIIIQEIITLADITIMEQAKLVMGPVLLEDVINIKFS